MSMHADNRARLAAAMREKYKQAGQYDIGLFNEQAFGGTRSVEQFDCVWCSLMMVQFDDGAVKVHSLVRRAPS